jgi:hypothetical protein
MPKWMREAVMINTFRWLKLRGSARLLLALLTGMLGLGLVWAAPPNQIEIKPKTNVEDKDDILDKKTGKRILESKIWVLDFKFYAPRLITVDIPGRGRKLCWYMKYQVTTTPRSRTPSFRISSG